MKLKKSASPGKEAIKHFRVLDPLAQDPLVQDRVALDGAEQLKEPFGMKIKIGNGAVICMGGDLLPIDAHNWSVPVWMI